MEAKWKNYIGRAKTTVPDTFNILTINNGDTVKLVSPPVLKWAPAECAKFYLIYPLRSSDTTVKVISEPGDTTLPFIPLFTFATHIELFAQHKEYFDVTDWYTIKVLAMDENAYERMERICENKPDRIEGGIGFVGSLSFDTAKVYVVVP